MWLVPAKWNHESADELLLRKANQLISVWTKQIIDEASSVQTVCFAKSVLSDLVDMTGSTLSFGRAFGAPPSRDWDNGLCWLPKVGTSCKDRFHPPPN